MPIIVTLMKGCVLDRATLFVCIELIVPFGLLRVALAVCKSVNAAKLDLFATLRVSDANMEGTCYPIFILLCLFAQGFSQATPSADGRVFITR